MGVRDLLAVDLCVIYLGDYIVDRCRRGHRDPAHRPHVHMTGDPVGEVDQLTHDPQSLCRALNSLEAVKGDAEDEEFRKVVRPHLVPVCPDGVITVYHGPPGRSDQKYGEDDREGLYPVGERGVDEVVRPCPEISEDQRPEGDDREPVAVNRDSRGLRQKVVKHGENRSREDEADGIMAVPPLDVGAVHPRKEMVGFEQTCRNREVVDDVEYRHREHRSDDEPEGDVHLLFLPLDHGAEDIHGKHHPQDHDRDVERPLELGVLQGLVHPHEEAQRCQRDADVEEIEMDPRQLGEKQWPLREPHRYIV